MAKRAVINGADQPLRIENCDLPDLPANAVRVRVAYAGVCHTDLHIKKDDGTSFGFKFRDLFGDEKYKKIVMGHEIAGYVDEIGSASNAAQLGYKTGDRVAVFPWQGCRNCGACSLENSNFCSSDLPIVYYLGSSPQVSGGYSTHVVVDPTFLVKIPDNIPLEVASILTCSGGTALSALKKLKKAVKFAQDTSESQTAKILILGAGGLGLWAVKFAKVMFGGKVHVMIAASSPEKLALAKQYGADESILWSRDVSEEKNVAKATKDGKVHTVVDFIGTAKTMAMGIKCLNKNGALVGVGLQGGEFSLSVGQVVLSGISVLGSIVFDMTEMREVVNLVAKHNITYPNIRYFTLDAVNEALNLLEKGQIAGRAVLKL